MRPFPESSGVGRACRERIDALLERAVNPEAAGPDLDRHLAQCEGCAEYLGWLMPASGLLAEAVPARQPPRDLKRRVMAQVRADEARQRRSADRSGWLVRPRIALAAAAAALIGGAGVALMLDGNEQIAPTVHPVIAKVAESPIEGRLVNNGSSGVLELNGLPRLEGDRVYQAWIRDGKRLAPSTVFVGNRTREAEAAIPEGLSAAEELLVTAEPQGGSAVPTSEPLLSVPLS